MRTLLLLAFTFCIWGTAHSCICTAKPFCEYYPEVVNNERSVILRASYLENDGNIYEYKVEEIYKGEIVTNDSPFYTGEQYVNTDSLIYVYSGDSNVCGQDLFNSPTMPGAIFALTYETDDDGIIGYKPSYCIADYYFIVPQNNSLFARIWDEERIFFPVEEFKNLIESDCALLTNTSDIERTVPNLYPNPTTSTVSLSNIQNLKDWDIRLLDINGRFLKEVNSPEINLDHYHSGIYLVEMTRKRERHLIKVIRI